MQNSALLAQLLVWRLLIYEVAFATSAYEVLITAPRPDQRFVSGASVPVQAFLYHNNVSTTSPLNWAMALTIDDGDTTIISGTAVNGAIPGLADGLHTIIIALVDEVRDGEYLGPRSRVSILVGERKLESRIRIVSPESALLWRDSWQRVNVTAIVENVGLDTASAEIHFDGVKVSSSKIMNAAQVEWHNNIESVSNGLHSIEATVQDGAGQILVKDKRFFEVGSRNLSLPFSGIKFAADAADCCDAVPGGSAFVAPPIPMQAGIGSNLEQWSEEPSKHALEEHCLLQGRIVDPLDTLVPKRFLILDAARIPLGNRLQFLASGALIAILSNRALLVNMGFLSAHFMQQATEVAGCSITWNFGSMREVDEVITNAVGGDTAYRSDGWAEGGPRRHSLRTTAAVPLAWVEVLTCTDLGQLLPGDNSLEMMTNQNLVPLIAVNPLHQARIVATWGNDALGHMLRWIIQPAAPVAQRLRQMRADAGGACLVGVQLRRRYGTAADRCVYRIPSPHGPERVPSFAHYTDEHEALLLDCAATLGRSLAYDGDDDDGVEDGGEECRGVVYYVSSDTPEEASDAAVARLGHAAVLHKGPAYYGRQGESVGTMGRSLAREMLAGGVGEYDGQGDGGEAGLRAVLDVLMLASCHRLVLTPSSTFGLMAAALAPPRQWRGAAVYPTRWGQCVGAVAAGITWSHSWLRVRRASCFRRPAEGPAGRAEVRPEMDMLCPDCTLWSCPCDGANPCPSHSAPENSLHNPRFTAHLPL